METKVQESQRIFYSRHLKCTLPFHLYVSKARKYCGQHDCTVSVGHQCEVRVLSLETSVPSLSLQRHKVPAFFFLRTQIWGVTKQYGYHYFLTLWFLKKKKLTLFLRKKKASQDPCVLWITLIFAITCLCLDKLWPMSHTCTRIIMTELHCCRTIVFYPVGCIIF